MIKKKIAIIIDENGWAFDNIATQIKKNIIEYQIDIIEGKIFEGNMIKLFLCCKEYDLIHFMWRGYLSLINRKELYDYVDGLGMNFEEFEQNYIYNKRITFSVCDELFLDDIQKWRTNEFMKYSKSYFVTSKKLYDIYSSYDKKPQCIINDGVDLNKYIPENLERFNNMNRKIIIGWVGNSKFIDSDNDSDMKGVEGIIKPTIEMLKNEGYDIELKLADRNISMITQSDMPNYYNSIDIYVCASKSEGTPLTILEAMAMGIPIVSTDVGIVSEVLGEKQKKYILEERNVECLHQKITNLINNKNEFKILSNENRNNIKGWDWKEIAKKYSEFFKKNM